MSTGYGLEAGQMKGYWDWYLRKDKDGRNPLASPLRAKKRLLKGLPPVLLMRAEHEILWDEISEMGRNLAEAGQEVRCCPVWGVACGVWRVPCGVWRVVWGVV